MQKVPLLNIALDVHDTLHIGNEGQDRHGRMLKNRYVVRKAHLKACKQTHSRGVALSVISKYRDAGAYQVPQGGGATQWPSIKPTVRRVAIELANHLDLDPTQQSDGPPMLNQLKILVCSELTSAVHSSPT